MNYLKIMILKSVDDLMIINSGILLEPKSHSTPEKVIHLRNFVLDLVYNFVKVCTTILGVY